MKHNGYPSRRAQRFFRSVRRWEAKKRCERLEWLKWLGLWRACVASLPPVGTLRGPSVSLDDVLE